MIHALVPECKFSIPVRIKCPIWPKIMVTFSAVQKCIYTVILVKARPPNVEQLTLGTDKRNFQEERRE